ncbi:hypothetical protein DQ04_05331010 [Trypanosoma grayi]|uniref:hypothetical protein n=1 Tax=Trypanosoma grayi TaxID=71804 RepID=UPI0004F42C56|nr:hypothetical protein DQ04_05331010 [Trypanosoma grayi]KEG09371.1 hypothetical protein DQ04_05331010 [Trypanosoma grayi]
MHLSADVLLACLTCAYWTASLLILALRVGEPRFGSLARYGGRYVAAPAARNSEKTHFPRRGVALMRQTHCWRWSRMCVAGVVAFLERSSLCRVQVSRKYSFCAFYLTGIVSSLLLLYVDSGPLCVAASTSSAAANAGLTVNDALGHYKSLPLIAFLIHCVVRFWECLCVHRFRGGPHDRVTLFAAAAGCSFYIFAASSSSLVVLHTLRAALVCRREVGASELPGGIHRSSSAVAPAAVVLFLLHLLLQWVQSLHHRMLAKLRGGPAGPRGGAAATSQQSLVGVRGGDARDAADALGSSSSSSTYCFPRTGLFAYVLEPHYACEIAMYVVNALSIWALVSPADALHVVLAATLQWEGYRYVLLLVTCCTAPLGVLLFSLCNLAITASEHRRFWNCVNDEQEGKIHVPRWNLFYHVW